MRMRRVLVTGLVVLLAGAVGGADPQAPAPAGQDDQQALQPSYYGKKICGFPKPDGVPQEVWENACEACTSMPTSPEASADGTLTSHSCDGPYEIRIKVVPGKTHPAGAKRDIMKGGGLGEEKPAERQERKVGA